MTYADYERGRPYEGDSHDGLNFLLVGLAAGAVLGAVVMLLMAPASGKKTRARLQKRTRQLRANTMDAVDDTLKHTRKRLDKATAGVRKQARYMSDRGQDMLDEQRERVAEMVEAGRKRMRMPGR